jgi:hypothetical protein
MFWKKDKTLDRTKYDKQQAEELYNQIQGYDVRKPLEEKILPPELEMVELKKPELVDDKAEHYLNLQLVGTESALRKIHQFIKSMPIEEIKIHKEFIDQL